MHLTRVSQPPSGYCGRGLAQQLPPGLLLLTGRFHSCRFYIVTHEGMEILTPIAGRCSRHSICGARAFLQAFSTTSIEARQETKDRRPMVFCRCAAIREGGQELHKLLKDTNRKLKVSSGLPDWKNYVDFVNSLVVQGLIRVVAVSLGTLNQQMSQAYIAKQQLPPMIELEMHLADSKVRLVADAARLQCGCIAVRCGAVRCVCSGTGRDRTAQ